MGITLGKVIALVDEIKPNDFSNEAKTAWLNECEGMVQTEVWLIAVEDVISYSYETDKDTVLLVEVPHSKIYEAYLTARIDYANGEYKKYQNTMQMFNQWYREYMRWYATRYRPADKREEPWKGHYFTAYGIAVKHGFQGSEEDWLNWLYEPKMAADAAYQKALEALQNGEEAVQKAENGAAAAAGSAATAKESKTAAAESAMEAAASCSGAVRAENEAQNAARWAEGSMNAAKAAQAAAEAAAENAAQNAEQKVAAMIAASNQATVAAERATRTAEQTNEAAAQAVTDAEQAAYSAAESSDAADVSAQAAAVSEQSAAAAAAQAKAVGDEVQEVSDSLNNLFEKRDIIPEQTVEVDVYSNYPDYGYVWHSENIAAADLVVGEEYYVVFNAEQHHCVAKEITFGVMGGFIVLGNARIANLGEDTGEPFAITSLTPGYANLYTNVEGLSSGFSGVYTHSVRVYQMDRSKVAISTDTTLTKAGKAADAKAVGDALGSYIADIDVLVGGGS